MTRRLHPEPVAELKRIAKLPGYKIISREPFFKEFAVQTPISPTDINRRLLPGFLLVGEQLADLAGGLVGHGHHDPDHSHEDGWIELKGIRYS